MAKKFEELSPKLITFIEEQKLFFVGTAMEEGRLNISPKGMNSLRVLGPNKVVWLNMTGSGNETATHLQFSDRMTILFCSFEDKPLILRLYGKAVAFHERDEAFSEYKNLFPDAVGARQIVEMTVDMVMTSCGYGIPIMEFKEERTQLVKFISDG